MDSDNLQGKKVVMVVAPADFRDEELEEPRRILAAHGADVTVASTTIDPVRGMLGATVSPDALLNTVRVDDFDAVVFVGGRGARSYFANDTALEVARQFATAGKLVGAICIAPVILANAGLLEGRNAAVFGSEETALRGRGALVSRAPVAVDGNIVTAEGPEAATQFGEALASELASGTGGSGE